MKVLRLLIEALSETRLVIVALAIPLVGKVMLAFERSRIPEIFVFPERLELFENRFVIVALSPVVLTNVRLSELVFDAFRLFTFAISRFEVPVAVIFPVEILLAVRLLPIAFPKNKPPIIDEIRFEVVAKRELVLRLLIPALLTERFVIVALSPVAFVNLRLNMSEFSDF